jgi:hypothetical protein
MSTCCYKNCTEEATTKGFVLARNPEGGKDIPTNVEACDKHKKVAGFFETTK